MDKLSPLALSTLAQPNTTRAAQQANAPHKTVEAPKGDQGLSGDCLAESHQEPALGILTRLALAKQAPQAEAPEQPQPQQEQEGIPLETLRPVAREAMTSRGLSTDFSPEALAEVKALGGPARLDGPLVVDMRNLQWVSIDNESTRDIDQLACCEDLGDGRKRLLVAIADVAESVKKGTALDVETQKNTVTVYNPGNIMAMLPEELSTDWTSLGPNVDRRAIVTELIIGADGEVERSDTFEATVRNHCKTDYKAVSGWLDGSREMPGNIANQEGMAEQVKLQIEAGEQLGAAARRRGALEFQADRVITVEKDGRIVDLEAEKKNRASEAVANMMIATNTETARFLHRHNFPVFQRVVKEPERWDRIREVAMQAASELPAGHEMPSEMAILPEKPEAAALSKFLGEMKERDPEHYGEVSFSMLKLMGGGDYLVTPPGEPLQGHFGQGVTGGESGYVHSTAPNRRLPDIIIQRMVKAARRGEPCPYTLDELNALADRCNQMESAAKGAERQVQKAAVASYLQTQVGEEFVALVTGNNKKGVFVKVIDPPIEGKLVEGIEGSDVGDRLRVSLRAVDPQKGHIDFARLEELPKPAPGHGPMLMTG
ncbi:RNB domain-containing ribonuclease [bacterium CPR1]|nr:RNB domain-containing ribonuclease [bacterium CPR1]